jgi:DNA polymerase III subunit delta'
LQGSAAEAKYELYCGLLETSLARLIRAEATGQGTEDERQLAARLVGPARLATFAGLWETLARERRETDEFNLDRKAFITGTWMRLKAAAAS